MKVKSILYTHNLLKEAVERAENEFYAAFNRENELVEKDRSNIKNPSKEFLDVVAEKERACERYNAAKAALDEFEKIGF